MPRPPKPSPPLPPKQAAELASIAASERPTTSPTLVAHPLSYHGLIRNTKAEGYPEWVITAKGRAWLAVDAEYRAARRPRATRTKES